MTKQFQPNLMVSKDRIEVHGLESTVSKAGFDTLNYTPADTALIGGEAEITPSTRDESTVLVVTSAQQLIDQTKLDLDFKAAYLGAKAGAALGVLKSVSFEESTVTVIAHCDLRKRVSNLGATEQELNQEALDTIENEGLDEFHRRYGGYYCDSVAYGGQVYLTINITMQDRRARDNFSTMATASYTTIFDVLAALEKDVAAESKVANISYAVTAIGAAPEAPDIKTKDVHEAVGIIQDYLDRFKDEVGEGEPYYGHYNSYWRRFHAELGDLEDMVETAEEKANALALWASAYIEGMGALDAMTDAASDEGYVVTSADRETISSLKADLSNRMTILHRAYEKMDVPSDFIGPEDIDGINDLPPEKVSTKIEAIRNLLLTQITYGMKVKAWFPKSGYYWSKGSKNLPEDVKEAGEDLPFVKVSKDPKKASVFTIEPADTAQNGLLVKFGHKISIKRHDGKYAKEMLYTAVPIKSNYVRTSTYHGDAKTKFLWTPTGHKSKSPLTTKTETTLISEYRAKFLIYPRKGYLGYDDDPSVESQVLFIRA